MQRQAPIYQFSTATAPKKRLHGHSPLRTLLAVLAIAGLGLLVPKGVGAVDYTWTGLTDNNWSDPTNWTSSDGGTQYPGWNGNAGADVAQFSAAATVTLDTTLTVTTLTINTTSGNLVSLDIGSNNLTVSGTTYLGTANIGRACTFSINGTGRFQTYTLDTNEDDHNVITLTGGVRVVAANNAYLDHETSGSCTFTGDASSSLDLPSGIYTYEPSNLTIENIKILIDNVPFSVSANPELASNTSSNVTITGNFVSGTQFYFTASITDANATTDESYTVDGTGYTNSVTAKTSFASTSGIDSFSFGMSIPATVDAGDGIILTLYMGTSYIPVGSIQYVQAEKTWDTSTGNTNWATASNWLPAGAPASGNIVSIPAGGTQPTIAAGSTADANRVIIEPGAILTMGDNSTLTANRITNNGTIRLYGTEILPAIRGGSTSSTVEYYGAGTPVWGGSYENLDIAASGTINASGSLVINGNLDLVSGTLAMGSAGLSLSGPTSSITNSGSALLSSSGTLLFDGSGAQIADLRGSSLNSATITTTGKLSGSLTFPYGFAIGTFTSDSGNYAIAFNTHTGAGGETTTLNTNTSFSNSGTLSTGNEADDRLNVPSGLAATAGPKNIGGFISGAGASNINLTGTATTVVADSVINGTTGTIGFNGITINDGLSLTLGGNSAATISIAGITAQTADSGSLVINNAGGTASVTGSVGAATVRLGSIAISKDGGSVAFEGPLYAAYLDPQLGAGSWDLAINGGGAVTNTVTFENTGTTSIGNQASDAMTFNAGATAVSGPKSLAGTITATAGSLSFGTTDTSLAANTSLNANAGAAAIILGDVTGAGFSLVANAGTGASETGSLGTNSDRLSSVALSAPGGSLTAGSTWTNGTQSFTAAAVVFNGSDYNSLLSSSTALTVNGALDLGASTTFATTGANVSVTGETNAATAGTQGLELDLGSGSWTAAAAIGLTRALGSLNLISGTLAMGTFELRIAGDLACAPGTLTSGGTLTLWGGAVQNINTTNTTLTNLQIEKTAGNAIALTPIVLSGNLIANTAASTLFLDDQPLDVAGSISGPGALTVAATGTQTISLETDFSITTFTPGLSTLLLDGAGAQSVTTNNQDLYNLSIAARTGGTISFTDELNVVNTTAGQGLLIAAGAYNIAINDGGTVAAGNGTGGAVAFNNTGTLTLNSTAIQNFTATAGLTATAPSSVTIAGTIETSGTGMALGLQAATPQPVILAANSILSTGATTGDISLGPVDVGATARTLEIIAGTGSLTASGQLGSVANPLASFTLSSAADADIQRGIVSQGTISLNNSGVLTLADPEGPANTADINISTTTGNFQQINASRVDVAADFSVAGTTNFESPMQLIGNVAAALAGDATFQSTIDSPTTAWDLVFGGNGTKTFQDAIGSSDPIGTLIVNGTTGLVRFESTVEAGSASQTNNANPIRFDNNVTLSGGPSSFLGDVNLDGLVFSSTGDVTFGSTPANSDSITLSGSDVTLQGSGDYTVYSSISGAQNLILAGGNQTAPITGSKTFYGAIGSPTPLLSITQADASGPVSFAANVNTGNLTTLANASFGPMTLTASGTVQIGSNTPGDDTATLIDATTWTGNAVYTIYAPLNGNHNLVLNGNGNKTFRAAVGGSDASTAIGTGTGAAISQMGSGEVFFESTVRTASGITQADTAGMITFRGNINSAAGNTNTNLQGDITLDGLTWTSGGAVTIGNAAGDTLTLSSDSVTITTVVANRDITIYSRVTGAENFALNSGTATARLAGPVGYDPPNRTLNLAVTAGSIEIAGGTINTEETQTWTGPVILPNGTTLSSYGTAADGNITFTAQIDSDDAASPRSLTVNTAGTLNLLGDIGATNPLAAITSDGLGNVYIEAGSIFTTGSQTWNDPVRIGANLSFESAATTDTAIHFASTLMPDINDSHSLEVDGGSAQVRFAGDVGNTTPLRFTSMDVTTTSTAANAILVEGSVFATGAIDWGAPLTIATTDNTDTLNSSGAPQTFAGTVTHTNGIIEAGAGGLVFGASYSATAAGSDDPTLTGYSSDTATIRIAGDMTLAYFTHHDDELIFDGAAIQRFNSNSQIIANLRTTGKTADNGLVITDSNIYQTGAARTTIIESGYLDLASEDRGWRAAANGTPSANSFEGIAGNLSLHPGTELRCGNLSIDTGYTVSHTGSGMSSLIAAGDVVFDGTLNGDEYTTLRMTGTGTTLSAVTTLGHLFVAGTVELASAIGLSHNLSIASGNLDVSASNHEITLAGHWTNSVVNSGFTARTGRVQFTRPAANAPLEIRGNNRWYIFECLVNGQEIRFENNCTQTFPAGATFRVQGSVAQPIIISRLTPDQTSDLNWVPPAEPDASLMWQLDMQSASTLDLEQVLVKYSDARSNAVVADVDRHVNLFVTTSNGTPAGETGMTCYRWLLGLQAVYSYTEDEDGNGRIDRIRVQAAGPLNMDFSAFDAQVEGYEIDHSKGTNGFEPSGDPSEFWIHLVEKNYADTAARPFWRILANTSLRDNATGTLPLVNFDGTGDTTRQQTTDTARPRILYTLALPGYNQRLIAFSEPVYAAGAAPSAADLAASSYTRPTPGGLDSSLAEYLCVLPAPISRSDIRNGANFSITASLVDGAADAIDYSIDPSFTDITFPAPRYLDAEHTPANTLLNNTHVHSDLLISREPAAADDAVYFVWPLFAKDSVTLDEGLAEEIDLDIFGIDGDTASSQTIGLVRAFDGSQWLRDQDFDLQARVFDLADNPPIVFDTNVGTEWLATEDNGPAGLWLPNYSHTDYSSITPNPNPNTDEVAGTPGLNNTVDYAFDASNPKIVSVSTLDFFFRFRFENAYGDGVNRYGARLDAELGTIPADWYRRIRPFSFDIHDVTKQRGNVTILNNVINPTRGETTRLSYQLSNSGPVTITVYTLDGSVVRSLYRGTRAAGDWTAVWDGRNAGGRVVARGLYFIRIVGPQIDEIRKVMVVK